MLALHRRASLQWEYYGECVAVPKGAKRSQDSQFVGLVFFTNKFYQFDKYISQFRHKKIYIWKHTFGQLKKYIFAICTKTFGHLDKQILSGSKRGQDRGGGDSQQMGRQLAPRLHNSTDSYHLGTSCLQWGSPTSGGPPPTHSLMPEHRMSCLRRLSCLKRFRQDIYSISRIHIVLDLHLQF